LIHDDPEQVLLQWRENEDDLVDVAFQLVKKMRLTDRFDVGNEALRLANAMGLEIEDDSPMSVPIWFAADAGYQAACHEIARVLCLGDGFDLSLLLMGAEVDIPEPITLDELRALLERLGAE
jgi:hypothetical protein